KVRPLAQALLLRRRGLRSAERTGPARPAQVKAPAPRSRRRRQFRRSWRGAALPLSAFLQRFGDFARHVSFIVLGKDAIGLKELARNVLALADNALAFA